MKMDATEKLREPIQELIDHASRINSYKDEKYWYPLSVATYGINEILGAIDSMCSFRTTMWKKVFQFEEKFSEWLGCEESIMVNSGSSADLLMAFALTNPESKLLQRGDEILVPSITWPTQIWSAMMAGLKVKFVDTDPCTLNMDLNDFESKISSKTKAVFLVHLMGNPCDMDRITELCKKHNILILEDCCESLGAKFKGRNVGTFGVASAFSFFFSHHLTTMEGGIVCCNDKSLSDTFRLLRAHGWARNTKYTTVETPADIDPRYMFLNWGFNLRPTELQAAFGLEQIKLVQEFHDTRVNNATYFKKYLDGYKDIMKLMEVLPDSECSWFALPIVLNRECPFSRSVFLKYLEDNGIETRPIVAGNLTRHPVSKMFPEFQNVKLPGSDYIHEKGFYLGVYPFESLKMMDKLVEIFDKFLADYR